MSYIQSFNSLKREILPHSMGIKIISYLTENTLFLDYKDQTAETAVIKKKTAVYYNNYT